jgi:MFS transporter, PHS family, inorganic phosphate transporter
LARSVVPNARFQIPAEIFPTRYRGTCHGISAAAGKLGSVISVAILHGIPKTDQGNPRWLGVAMILFSLFMASGFVFAWAWIPDVQRPERVDGKLVLKSKTLEELATSTAKAPRDGQLIGLRKKLALVKSHLFEWWSAVTHRLD